MNDNCLAPFAEGLVGTTVAPVYAALTPKDTAKSIGNRLVTFYSNPIDTTINDFKGLGETIDSEIINGDSQSRSKAAGTIAAIAVPGIKANAGLSKFAVKGPGNLAGTMSNVEARTWYLKQEASIPGLINKDLSLQQQARQAFNLRNQFRTQTREMMSDRELAASLNKTDPNLTWNQVVKKYSGQGLKGDDLWNEIIQSSTRSRQSVNSSLGL